MTSAHDPRWSAQALSAAVGHALQRAAPPASVRADTAIAAWTDIDAWRPWLSAAAAFVDDAQAARASALRQRDEQERRRLTHALHRLVAAHGLGLPPRQLRIERDGRGCPRLPGRTASTSLSHSGAVSAFAVCPRTRVGIDIESRPARVDMLELAHRVAHPAELAGMDAADAGDRRERLLALWVRKEACLKAMGVGLVHPMETFMAGLDEDVVLPAQDPPVHVRLHMLPPHAAWIGAVAAPVGVDVRMVHLLPPGE